VQIIAGTLKGRRLKAPTWEGLRPTSSRLRETLFNLVAPRIDGARVLDGYAGTGAIGIEALSRGAATVVFVEQDRRAQALIAENLERCGVRNGYVIIRAGLAHATERLRRETSPGFDLVLLDPPYEGTGPANDLTTEFTAVADLLLPSGLLVLEHARRRGSPERIGPLVRTRDVITGDSGLALYACPL
jgi:16S rRNA (guanine966-N2)-methyltransferase